MIEKKCAEKKCCSCKKEGKIAKGKLFTLTLVLVGAVAIYRYFF